MNSNGLGQSEEVKAGVHQKLIIDGNANIIISMLSLSLIRQKKKKKNDAFMR